jgi:hypothetical protein
VRRAAKTIFGVAMVLGMSLSCRRGAGKSPAKPLLPGVPSILRFQPPADGLVTDAQLDRYVKARRAARGRGEEGASRAVGVDPEEFAWVKARIIEALVYLETAQVRGAAEGTYSRTIASLKEASKGAKDRETTRKLEEQIAALEKERAGLKAPDNAPPSVVANAKRIAPRRAELQAPPQ